MRSKVLVVDDEPYMLELIETILRQNPAYETRTLSDPLEAMHLLEREPCDLVLLDLRMPGLSGMDLLEKIKKRHPRTEVVIVTAYGSIPLAVEAMQTGAADFITKPFNKKEIVLVVEKVLKWQALKRENLVLKEALADKYDFKYLVGSSRAVREVCHQAQKLAPTDIPIHLEGEIGTGKSHLAKAIHYHSPRSGGPFLDLVMGAVGERRAAALLFGRGGDGSDAAPGLIERAEGGTLYLAEIQALAMPVQKRLARLIEEGEYEPEGPGETRRADVRLVFSSESGLRELADRGLIDQEFFLSLARFPLTLPPLRDRRVDIPVLVDKFIQDFSRVYGKKVETIDDEALKWLVARDWPGNLREMENTIERAVVLAPGDTIGLDGLRPAERLTTPGFRFDREAFGLSYREALNTSLDRFQAAFERHYFTGCLIRFDGDLEKAADHMGLTAPALKKRLAGLDLRAEDYGRRDPVS